MITNTELITTPTSIFSSIGKSAINLITFCNLDDMLPAKLSVAVVPSGESLSNVHYLIYKTVLPPLETLFFSQEKLILDDGDVVYAYATQTDEMSSITVVTTVSSLGL